MEVTKHKEEQGNGKEAKKAGIDPFYWINSLSSTSDRRKRPELAGCLSS